MLVSTLLLTLSIMSFIFYGVVGQDKIWIMGPALILNYTLICFWFLTKIRQPIIHSNTNVHFKLSLDMILWIFFLLYAASISFFSSVTFESKLEVLFIGSIIGSFIVWRSELTSSRYNRKILGILIFFIMLCVLYGIVIHFKSPEQILWTERYTESYEGRLRATYICPNHFAHLLQLILSFSIILIFIKQSTLSLKLLSLYSTIVILPALFLTESRAAWLGSIMSIGVLLALFLFRKNKKFFYIFLFIGPVFTSIMLISAWNYSETFNRRMQPVVQFFQSQSEDGIGSESRDFRPQTWMDTITMIKNKPLLGFGPGTYRHTFPEYRERFKGYKIVTGHPHNEYLELITDYGLIGFFIFSIAWCNSIIFVLRKSLLQKSSKNYLIGFASIATIFGSMVHSLFDFQMHIYPNAMVFSFLVGLSSSQLESPKDFIQKKITNHITKYFILLIFVICLVLCIQSSISELLRASAENKFDKQKNSFLDSVEKLNLSNKYDASNWSSFKALGELYYNKRYFSTSIDEKHVIAELELNAFKNAYNLNPYDAEICKGLANSYIFIGNYIEDKDMIIKGLDLLKKSCYLRKYNDDYWWLYATELRNFGNYEESIEVFKKMKSKTSHGFMKDKDIKLSVDANIAMIYRNMNSSISPKSEIIDDYSIKYISESVLDVLRSFKKKSSNE